MKFFGSVYWIRKPECVDSRLGEYGTLSTELLSKYHHDIVRVKIEMGVPEKGNLVYSAYVFVIVTEQIISVCANKIT